MNGLVEPLSLAYFQLVQFFYLQSMLFPLVAAEKRNSAHTNGRRCFPTAEAVTGNKKTPLKKVLEACLFGFGHNSERTYHST